MPLIFPDLDTLRLALTTGAIPAAVAQAPVQAGFDDEGQVWANTAAALPRNAQARLKELNVQTSRTVGPGVMSDFTCWPQIFALERTGERTVPTAQVPVLFELPGEQLSSFVAEMLRLGNDRQSFRYLEEKGSDAPRALLRVFGPPYYTLLRAIDRNGAAHGAVAYVEAIPRVWVELGYTHPFSKHIKLPEGKVLLMRPPRQWLLLDEGPYREIYEVLEFPLPASKSPWKDTEPGKRLQVPLRLKPAGAADAAELWVLRNRPVEQLDSLVSGADDQRLRQLSFAVAVQGGEQVIVLRVRPSKHAPPVVVVDGIAYRSYLKLPNLFLPSGTVLNPPLRRDAVRRLLADDPGVITWLHPAGDGKFVPETLPDTAFRPLSDWIDYILDHDREDLQTWVQAAQFDFEPFICNDEQPPKPKKPPAEKGDRDRKGGREGDKGDEQVPVTALVKKKDVVPDLEDEAFELRKTEPSVLEKELTALEEKFKAIEGPLDSAEHRAIWPEMAVRNGALGRSDDAGLCWMSTFWFADDVGPSQAWQWFRSEAGSDAQKPDRSGPRAGCWSAGIGAPGSAKEVQADNLEEVLGLEDPTTADVRSLAAYIFWAARRDPPPQILLNRLGKVRHFLEEYEHRLPVRAVWLAWTSLVQLSRGDELGLARTRDRLLERLFQGGLRPEQDLPSFLRFAGGPGNERFRAFRTWMVGLGEQARQWVLRLRSKDIHSGSKAATDAYVELMFSFGLARLGESEASKLMLQRGRKSLEGKDPAHNLLLQAFTYRIDQVLGGQPHAGPLPPALLGDIEGLDQSGRYMVDRLRQESRILEPAQKIDPYRYVLARIGGLDRDLAEIADITDRKELADRVKQLLDANKSSEAQARILKIALSLAPRVSEDFALLLLSKLGVCLDGLGDVGDLKVVEDLATLIDRGLFTAAHFDRSEYVQSLVARFLKLLQAQKSPNAITFLEAVAAQSFRGLRKVGMKDEIEVLLRQTANTIVALMGAKSVPELFAASGAATKNTHWHVALRALLHVAAGWLYFGQDKQAQQVLDAARTLLLSKSLDYRQQTPLACAYVSALSQASPEMAQKRIDELFRSLEGIHDTFTTNTYYSRFQLLFIESVVLAVVTDDFTMGTNVRRWLDDDEFLVRRRIHSDLRNAMNKHE